MIISSIKLLVRWMQHWIQFIVYLQDLSCFVYVASFYVNHIFFCTLSYSRTTLNFFISCRCITCLRRRTPVQHAVYRWCNGFVLQLVLARKPSFKPKYAFVVIRLNFSRNAIYSVISYLKLAACELLSCRMLCYFGFIVTLKILGNSQNFYLKCLLLAVTFFRIVFLFRLVSIDIKC